MALDPAPLDVVRRRGLDQFLPQLLILEHPPLRFQPRASHPATHSLIPLTRYCESDTYTTTRACFHWRRIHSKVAIAPARAILLFVVCGGRFIEVPRATLSPAGASISAAFRGGCLRASLPRQLFIGVDQDAGPPPPPARASATSGWMTTGNVGVSQDFLCVRDDQALGPALDVAHGAREQALAADPLDDCAQAFPRVPDSRA